MQDQATDLRHSAAQMTKEVQLPTPASDAFTEFTEPTKENRGRTMPHKKKEAPAMPRETLPQTPGQPYRYCNNSTGHRGRA
jgi:hypothetical protein